MIKLKFLIFITSILVCQLSFAQQNVLLIIADDIGIDYTSGYNSPLDIAPTPNIDQLASEGVLFKNAWANPLCSPTRATMLTGRYGFRTGVGYPVSGGNAGVELDEYTLPMALADLPDVDYTSACIGKWHLSTNQLGGNQHPNLMGFDDYIGNIDGMLDDYYNWEKVTNNVSETITNYATTENVNDAIKWVDLQSKPWLLWLSFNAVHTPFHKPPSNLHSYTLDDYTEGDDAVPYFNAMIESMDTEIGRLISHLKSTDAYDNTHIIYVGDNGTLRQVIKLPFKGTNSKGTLYEGGVHVPLIVSGPAVTEPSRTTDALVNLTDIYSTVLSMVGVDYSQNESSVPFDSQSFSDILSGEATEHRNWLYSEMFNIDGLNSKTIRDKEYHLIVNTENDEELYNLQTDKYERNNLLLESLGNEAQASYTQLKNWLDELSATNTAVEEYEMVNGFDFTVGETSKHQLSIRLDDNNIDGSITIFNLMGNVIATQSILSQQTTVELNEGGPSLVFVSVENNGRRKTKKVVLGNNTMP